MRRWMGMPIAAVLALTACVTINVYFPAAEAREAAKEFVDKVIGDDAQPSTPAPASDEPAGDGGGMVLRFDPLMLLGIGTAHAQGTPDISLKTPRSEEHTSEPQSLMRTSYAVFCLKQKK